MIHFLDVSVILHPYRTFETDIYYKDTNFHDYHLFDSAHPGHSKGNVPYNLAKRIIVFVSNEEKTEYILNDLKNWLKSSKHPENIINRAFHNAILQFPAPLRIRKNFNGIQSDHLKNVFKNSSITFAQK